MPYEFRLPDIGEGVAEAEIVRWLVRTGDRVAEHQPLVEVLTDKATVEIPSPRDGIVVRLGAEEGAILPVGRVLVEIETEGGRGDSAPSSSSSGGAPASTSNSGGPIGGEVSLGPAADASTPPRASGSVPAAGPSSRVEAVPAARALARERGLDLSALRGTGPGGRITLDDVKRALEAGAQPVSQAAVNQAAPGPEERVPLRGLRRKIAEHMTHAAHTIPHYTFVAEADMSAVVAARKRAQERAAARGVKLTYMAYIIRALVPALVRYPLLNASLDDERQEIVLKRSYNIGIAVATEDGLTVPVLRGAGSLGLMDVAAGIDRLARGARQRKLALEELSGATFTVTSTGAYGGVLATPIIHHPQVAILGVHEVKPRAVVRDGQIVARDMVNLSLSLDHRVVDGQVGAEFLYAVVANLEDPNRVPLDDGDRP